MSWFDTAGIASFAKSALTTAQKTIDKALDIQEEKNERQTHSKADADSFFEAFGLNDKPSTSQPSIIASNSSKTKPCQSIPLESTSQESDLHGSGFWSETWGSFFEIKNQEDNFRTKNQLSSSEDIHSECNDKNDNAVLSQPQKASLFPGDSCPSQSSVKNDIPEKTLRKPVSSLQELSQNEKFSSLLPLIDTSVSQFMSKNEEPSDKIASGQEITENVPLTDLKKNQDDKKKSDCPLNISVVTEQPCHESIKIEIDLSKQISAHTSQSTEILLFETSSLDKTSTCDTVEDKIQHSNSILSKNSVPVEILPLNNICDKAMEGSTFFSLQMPNTDEQNNEKIEREYDVIESANNNKQCEGVKEFEDTSIYTEITSNSSYDISSSTLVIPDLPVSVPENVANWECCVSDTLSPDLFISEGNDNDANENKENSSITQLPNSLGSFLSVGADSFNNNGSWIANNQPVFIDESQNSSNGEHNSHHTDGSSNSSKDDDDTDTAEVKEFDAKSSSSAGSHTTSSSFVKCSADDNNSTRGHSPTSTIASERSDATKQESTSGDENETATSSDIEILSPPNGENDRNSSPLKHIWLPRPLRFRRSESPTSDSSKDSMMPVVSELDEVCYINEPNLPSAFYSSKEERFHGLKDYEENDSIGQLLQKQDELQNLLDVREKKLVELSKENIELQENEQRLKNLIQKMRAEQAKESMDISALTREFSKKLSFVEGQLKDTTQERDFLKAQLEEIKLDLASRISKSDFEDVIREKDQQIKELTEEGQKLSKKELQHTTIIKKLRAKAEENTKIIKSQKEELDDNTQEVERLRKSISAKEQQEKKHIDAIRDLSSNVKKLEKEVSCLKSDLEDSQEKELSLKKSLDSTYKDFTELKKSYAAKEIEVQDLKSSLELQAQENLEQTLENAKRDAAREKESLLLQIQDLRSTLSRSEEEANLREKMFKTEIASLQKRLQEAEERNEDLTKNISSATRPLVRQIENLQATFTTQTISWEKIEKSLTDRLSDAQNQIAFLSEKERATNEKFLECQSKVIALESQNSSLRQDKLKLTSELESLRTNLIMLEENKNRENYTLEKVKQNFNAEIRKLKQEKVNLENTMATCLEQLDMEKRKVAKLEEEIKVKETRAMILSNVSPCPSPTGSVRSSVSSIHNWSQDESHDPGLHTPVNSYRMSVYESLRLGSGSSLLENLQSQLKQREGEIYQLQSEIAKLEQVKEFMTRELVQLTEQNEELDKRLAKLESLEKEHRDLDQKYNTLLQMYGEKVEETEELQLDLADVKSMYKAQIEELLMKK